MNIQHLLFGAAALALTACSSPKKSGNSSSPASSADGFVSIFDGKTLNGWDGDLTYWRVEDGCLTGEITPSTLLKRNQFVVYRSATPADFELTLDFKITKSGNSGVNYRSDELDTLKYALRGYQEDIDGANRYTGQNYEERKRTTLAYRGEIATINPPPADSSLKDMISKNAWLERTVTGSTGNGDSLANLIHSEDWNSLHIIARGNHLQHYINGVLMSDVTDNDPVNRKASGLIGVQVHVGPPMKVQYKNILLKQL